MDQIKCSYGGLIRYCLVHRLHTIKVYMIKIVNKNNNKSLTYEGETKRDHFKSIEHGRESVTCAQLYLPHRSY